MKLSKISKFFKKKTILFVVIIIGMVAVSGFFLYRPQPNPLPTGMILFEGKDCKQCDNVDTFIENNKVEEKVAFTRLEVFHNETNANFLSDRAQICGLNSDQIGVPFLWDGEHCIIGYVDVINFFKAKINSK